MSDYIRLCKEIKEIENIIKSISYNNDKEYQAIVELNKKLYDKSESLDGINFLNYLREALI